MNGDPQLRERFERSADSMRFDTARTLDRVHRVAEGRDRSRRLQALAVAAAIIAVALVITWRLAPSGGGFVPMGAVPAGRIAYLGADGLSQVDVATGATSPLFEGTVTSAAWTRDGSRLAVALEGPGPTSRVVVTDPDGTDPVTVYEAPDADLPGPDIVGVAWSPDDARLALAARAVAHGRTIVVVDADGGGGSTVFDGHWEGASWSPDGTRLVAYGFPQLEGGSFDLYTMTPEGSDLVQLTDDDVIERQPSWSPDGTMIVFSKGDSYAQDVLVMAADGSNVHRLTEHDGLDLFPVWSPDGGWIAFASDRDLSPAEQDANRSGDVRFRTSVYVMGADGSNVRRVSGTGTFLPVSWSGLDAMNPAG